MTETIELNINDILRDIKRHLKRAGWKKEQTEKHLIITYYKNKILKLDDDELIEFMNFCAQLPNHSLFKFRELKFRTLLPAKPQLDQQLNNEPAF